MGEPTEKYMGGREGGREGRGRDMESKDKFKRTLTSLHVHVDTHLRGVWVFESHAHSFFSWWMTFCLYSNTAKFYKCDNIQLLIE